MASTIAELRSILRLPADTGSLVVLSAMLGERLPLDAASAAAIRRALRRHDDDPAAGRLAARALAAGLDPEGAAVDRVMGILDSADEGGQGGANQSDDGAHQGDDGAHQGDAEAILSKIARIDDNDSVDELAASLKAAIARSALEPDVAALSAPGIDGGGWVCLPFALPYDGVDFRGFVRVWYNAGQRSHGRFIADIRSGGQRRLLEISPGGAGPCGIRYCADDEAERAKFIEAFGAYGKVTAAGLAAADLAELDEARGVVADA